jgi:L-amino acid N-acyltransferase YncA
MPPSIGIRWPTIADAEIITDIWCEGAQAGFACAAPGRDAVAEFFRNHLETETGAFGYWIAEVHGQVIGWQSLLRTRPNPISRWAHSSTYVSLRNRARGVGRARLAFANTHARDSGISHIEGFVLASNIRGDSNIGIVRVAELRRRPGRRSRRGPLGVCSQP